MTDADYIPRLFRESAVDGLLINLDAKLPDTLIDVFDRQPVPAVLLNLKRSTRCVYPDEVGGGAAAARHVIATGCRRVGFLMHDPINERSHFSRADRLRGVADTLQEAGMPPLRPVVGEAAFDRGSGRGVEMAEALLATRGGLDAVVCYDLPEALSIYMAAVRRGLRIPDDLRLVVFSDKVVHAITGTPMDTVMVPFKAVGLRAVKMLNVMIEGPDRRRIPGESVPYKQIFVADRRVMKDASALAGGEA